MPARIVALAFASASKLRVHRAAAELRAGEVAENAAGAAAAWTASGAQSPPVAGERMGTVGVPAGTLCAEWGARAPPGPGIAKSMAFSEWLRRCKQACRFGDTTDADGSTGTL